MLTRLPEILEAFRRDHPEVELELTVELSGTLHERLAAGKLDLVLAKRRPEDPPAPLVRRDRLVWIGAERLRLDPEGPVPLIVYPPPGITRDLALRALERAAAGLQRRARVNANGADERIFLTPLMEFADANETPAERKLSLFHGDWNGNIDPVFQEFAY